MRLRVLREPSSHVPTSLIDGRFRARAERARRLATERPAVAETLLFYAALLNVQETILRTRSVALHADLPLSRPFIDRLDRAALPAALRELIDGISRVAPAPAAQRLARVAIDRNDWAARIESYWISAGRSASEVADIERFVLFALLQPFAEAVALNVDVPPALESEMSRCPRCTANPLVATLREQSHGARRSLVCSFCLTEWPALRLLCLTCGEARFESLPVFRAEEYDSVRLDACESCRTYMKTIDLTRDGAALPVVDDLASLPLDLWAEDQGYRRATPNVWGM